MRKHKGAALVFHANRISKTRALWAATPTVEPNQQEIERHPKDSRNDQEIHVNAHRSHYGHADDPANEGRSPQHADQYPLRLAVFCASITDAELQTVVDGLA